MEPDELLSRLRNATVGIYGYGNTGRTLAKNLTGRVEEIIVYEDDPTAEPGDEPAGEGTDVRWVVAPTVLQDELDYLLVSPGIPGDHPMLRQAREFEIPVWGDLELSYRLMEEGTIWAITGTNGKSTCAELLGRLLEEEYGESAVAVCGNRGSPFLDELMVDDPPAHYVVEVSSFQVENMDRFQPDAALLTNLGDDHMNYHESTHEYHGLKLNLLKRVPEEKTVVLPDSEADRDWLERRDVRRVQMPHHQSDSFDYREGDGLYIGQELIPEDEIPESLRQFPENILTTLEAVKHQVNLRQVKEAFEAFEPLPYRAQPVETANGKIVINDSKGTNPSAVLEQLARRDEPIHLVLGGEAKQTNYDTLITVVQDRNVRSITLAGEGSTASVLSELCERESVNHRWIADWEEAVKTAYDSVDDGETLLLSPGGTSFDAFENYKQRGEEFDRWIREVDGS